MTLNILGATIVLCAVTMGPLGAAVPAVGDTPPDFQLKSVAGNPVSLADLSKRGDVALIVLRGYPGYQCPVCNRQVQEFLARAGEFASAGAQVVMVYPGPPDRLDEKASEFVRDMKFPNNFHLLLDPDYRFTNLYSLRWDAPKETAYPSTFVIGKKGKVKFAKVSRTHGGRSSASEVLAALRAD